VEIRRVLDDPNVSRIDEYEAALSDELAERKRILDYVRRYLKEEQMPFEVDVKKVEEQPYVSRAKRVRISDLERFVVTTLDELIASHESAGNAFTVYHGEVNEEDDGPVEVCLPVAAAERKLPAGEVAYTVAVGEQTTFPEIIGAYDAVAEWAKANGRELAGPPREIYLDEVTNHRPHMEIAWPIR
jgi:effector-binding domain-containing protein